MRTADGGQAFIRVTCGPDTWDFDTDELTFAQMASIETEYGHSGEEWLRDIQRGLSSALKILVWYVQGRKIPPSQLDDMKFGDFDIEILTRSVKKTPKAAGKKPEIVRSAS